MKKRAVSLLLVVVLLFSLFPLSVFAEGEGVSMDTPVGTPEYAADTSLGTLLIHTLENEEGDTSFPGTVTDLRIEGTTASVELSTDRASELVVAIYPDSDTDVQMLASGTTRIEAGKQSASVSIDIASMPEYYIAAAYLLDPETHEPLSQSYISRYYTEEFQTFLKTTTADYDQNLVLNLDEDTGNNFLVFDESVLRFTQTPGVNELSDNGNGTYTIRHAD
ncbi:MAG: hypothetical protein K6C08_07125, partial [Oscillospiraceae bacterium]|nr:hypothetical protein [Oscillospiraceae bacterium]